MLTDDLLELQRIDTTVDQLTYRRAHLPEREEATATADALRDADRRRAAAVQRNDELERAVTVLEQEGARSQQQRERLNAQLRTVTAQREVDALMHELEALSQQRDERDDRELAHLEEQAALQTELTALDDNRPALSDGAEQAAAALGVAEGIIEADLVGLAAARAELVTRLDPGAVERYERLRARFGGVAVARLEASRCSGCHLDLSRAELDAVRATPPGEFADCPQCGRLLVP